MKSKRHSLIERLEIRRLLSAVEGIDTSFGKNGRADVPADVLVAPLPNGEYLVVGSNRQTDEDSAAPNVSLLTTNGVLDTTFGNGGQTIVPQIGFGAKAVLAGNQVLIASNVDDGLVDVFALKLDGTINESFARHSFVDIPAPPLVKGDVFDDMTVDSIAAQSDGSAIVAIQTDEAPKGGGTTTTLSELVRVTSSGKFDSSFGDNGFALVASHVNVVDSTLSFPNITIDSKDRILLVTALFGTDTGQLDRFNADGTLDHTFGDKGVVQITSHTFGVVLEIASGSMTPVEAVQPDDKIILGGTIDTHQENQPAMLFRLNTDGSLDTTFGTNGQVQIAQPIGVTTIGAMTIDSQGRIIVSDDASIVRLTPTGTFDKKFSSDGVMDFVDAVQAAGFNATNAGVTDAADRILLGDQDGVIRLSPQQPAVLDKGGRLLITGSDGGDTVAISAHEGVIHANVNGAVVKFAVADVKKIEIDMGAGNNTLNEYVDIDTIINATSTGDETDSIQTGGGDDAITASGGSVTIDSGAGDDHIHAGEGDFTIHGGAGDDLIVAPAASSTLIFGDDGNDSILGSPGNDSLYGGAGGDTIHAGEGDDYLSGGGGRDFLIGRQGNDTIYGGNGNDVIDGGPGKDLLAGQSGNDRLFAADGEVDSLYGGDGTDSATLDINVDTVVSVENVN